MILKSRHCRRNVLEKNVAVILCLQERKVCTCAKVSNKEHLLMCDDGFCPNQSPLFFFFKHNNLSQSDPGLQFKY